jgi:hypothetical protein
MVVRPLAEMRDLWTSLASTSERPTRTIGEKVGAEIDGGRDVAVVVVVVVAVEGEAGGVMRMPNLYQCRLHNHYAEMRLLSNVKWPSTQPSPCPTAPLEDS